MSWAFVMAVAFRHLLSCIPKCGNPVLNTVVGLTRIAAAATRSSFAWSSYKNRSWRCIPQKRQ